MKVIIQRVLDASVSIESKVYNAISKGYLLYVGFTHSDTTKTVDLMIQKILKLRIYEDENQKINLSIPLNYDILCISQFTLYAQTKGQHRPSFIEAMKQEEASYLYDYMIQELSTFIQVKSGVFQKHMIIKSTNDGPMTILLEV
jgi:D-tyrosyl-tRNA(Tyr) deacylase